jgi:prolyl 4-hydroxylase
MKTDPKGYLQLNPFPNVKKIHSDPPMYYVENFLSPTECKNLIAMSDKKVKVSLVVDKQSGVGVTHSSRTSESCYYGYDLKWLISRVARLTGIPENYQEPAQFTRYVTGQFYQSHLDALDKPENGAQRIGTVLIYLNNVQKGGATYFNHLNLRIQPKEGDAVIFFPAKMDGTILDNMLHTAEDASDTKWVSQVWLRNKPYKN